MLTSHQDVEYFHNIHVIGKQSSVWLCAPSLYTILVCRKLDESHLHLVVYHLKLPASSNAQSNPLPSISFPMIFSAQITTWSSPIWNTNPFFTSFSSIVWLLCRVGDQRIYLFCHLYKRSVSTF